jgi:Na+/phosphate symporter
MPENDVGHLTHQETVDYLIKTLERETDALNKGDWQALAEILGLKKSLLSHLEKIAPTLENEVKTKTPASETLRKTLSELKTIIDSNMKMLQSISIASRDISKEVQRIKKKHSLDGLYTARGNKKNEQMPMRSKIDKTL